MEWRVPVWDGMSRRREIVVTVTDGVVVIKAPPGEGFRLDPDDADTLAYSILTASNYARRT